MVTGFPPLLYRHIKGHFITRLTFLLEDKKTILKDNDRKVKKKTTVSHCESNPEVFPLAASPLTTELRSPNNHQPSQPFMYMAQVYASATHLAVWGWLENPPQQERTHASIYLPHNIKCVWSFRGREGSLVSSLLASSFWSLAMITNCRWEGLGVRLREGGNW